MPSEKGSNIQLHILHPSYFIATLRRGKRFIIFIGNMAETIWVSFQTVFGKKKTKIKKNFMTNYYIFSIINKIVIYDYNLFINSSAILWPTLWLLFFFDNQRWYYPDISWNLSGMAGKNVSQWYSLCISVTYILLQQSCFIEVWNKSKIQNYILCIFL
jgi:hypothetical protein